jgi:hypothetical protein
MVDERKETKAENRVLSASYNNFCFMVCEFVCIICMVTVLLWLNLSMSCDARKDRKLVLWSYKCKKVHRIERKPKLLCK